MLSYSYFGCGLSILWTLPWTVSPSASEHTRSPEHPPDQEKSRKITAFYHLHIKIILLFRISSLNLLQCLSSFLNRRLAASFSVGKWVHPHVGLYESNLFCHGPAQSGTLCNFCVCSMVSNLCTRGNESDLIPPCNKEVRLQVRRRQKTTKTSIPLEFCKC